ncbi:hypothetical protein N7539_007492 [Penicillium diatomitis]|uniref:Uncharacterized protein n=1 Tax=Penicillium diatomitis TaxID=2819901 RepID=A0A9W9WV81_9EURO|nr:uncharacterized protein N7539_007492 [Penicillium diatomitis]KAJ5477348.1 hypothetical protein N7539_007492 [Penicillium diatomitis]
MAKTPTNFTESPSPLCTIRTRQGQADVAPNVDGGETSGWNILFGLWPFQSCRMGGKAPESPIPTARVPWKTRPRGDEVT